ncbi:hypothetical protein [Pedobacter sp. B4-66]|uniref:hypothetical protein n=1 Tax=Pedobacter sp. B4-66 TaxID=2817280 RepID=UPI001BDAC0B3|nr:hypothetical protein [Pedobacter sp. B4-66]
MCFILELLFGIVQGVAYWTGIEGRKEHRQSTSSRYAAIALVAVLLLVVILIWRYNPEPHTTIIEMI